MKVTSVEIGKYLKRLEETPHGLAAVTQDIEDARLQAKPGNQLWSANDILAHLRSCADMWGSSMDAMLAEDKPTLPDVHPRKWIKETNYPELPFHESFEAFVQQRRRLLTTLQKLSLEDWSREAVIGGRRHTVFSQARRMAKHEAEHVEQVEALLRSAANGSGS